MVVVGDEVGAVALGVLDVCSDGGSTPVEGCEGFGAVTPVTVGTGIRLAVTVRRSVVDWSVPWAATSVQTAIPPLIWHCAPTVNERAGTSAVSDTKSEPSTRVTDRQWNISGKNVHDAKKRCVPVNGTVTIVPSSTYVVPPVSKSVPTADPDSPSF